MTDEDRDRLRKEFLSPYRWAINVVGDQLQAARWDWPELRVAVSSHSQAARPYDIDSGGRANLLVDDRSPESTNACIRRRFSHRRSSFRSSGESRC